MSRTDVRRAMTKYRKLAAVGREQEFFDAVSAGRPKTWHLLDGEDLYPLKALWANAQGIKAKSTHTNSAKQNLTALGFGPFVESAEGGRQLSKRLPNLSDLDRQSAAMGGGGEGEAHRKLKEWVSKNPQAIGLPIATPPGAIEFPLPSGDSIDVLFTTAAGVCAVEVKPANAPAADINRGLFQCVKYHAVLQALQRLGNSLPPTVKLVLAGGLPQMLETRRMQLGIETIERIGPQVSRASAER